MQNEESLSVKFVKSVVQFIWLRLGALCQRSRFRESLSEAKSDKVMAGRSALCAQRNKMWQCDPFLIRSNQGEVQARL
jgi:hypothetical protein